jgi:prolipoprotein diacylglyceryltransferase
VQFPYYFHVFGLRVHPHPVMEGTAYAVGAALRVAIGRWRGRDGGAAGEGVVVERRLWQAAGAVIGALAGAKLLAWAENWRAVMHASATLGLEAWIGGKTIVGGLAGGWAGVEIAKRLTGVKERTGDLWVYPLCVSMAIGRVGCFLTGLSDDTYGTATGLPWGVDFGDGIRRHPTQLYESVFMLVLAGGLALWQWRSGIGWRTGRVFRWFMLWYCGWRFCVEFIKPTDKWIGGLSVIQVFSLGVCAFCVWRLWREREGRGALAVLGVEA